MPDGDTIVLLKNNSMKHKILVISFILFQILNSFCQSQIQIKQGLAAKEFIEGYNLQDYDKMKKPFSPFIKLLPLKKALKNEFGPQFLKTGKLIMGPVNYKTDEKIVVELITEKDTSEKEYLVINFDSKNKITGLGFKSPDFNYPKIINKSSIPDDAKQAKIDRLIANKFIPDGFNGAVMALDKGKIIFRKTYGYSNYETKQFLNDSSLFELASCSKQFIAMAILILKEQGKLKLTDTLQKYIPLLPYKNITIENLLTHTSGIPDYMELLSKHWDKHKFATNYDVVELLTKYKPKIYFLPNEIFDYSNTGYVLLSVIIEKASGLSYSAFLDKYIFKALGMKSTRVYNTRRSKNEILNNYAYGYVYSSKTNAYILPDLLPDYQYVKYLDAITGDGAVNTTLPDLELWDNSLREYKLVSRSTLDKAFSSYILPDGSKTNYGYGFFVNDPDKYEKVIYHTGGWPGYRSIIIRFIDQGKTVVVLSNNEYDSFDKLADKVAKVLIE